jgi:hypothetical protein
MSFRCSVYKTPFRGLSKALRRRDAVQRNQIDVSLVVTLLSLFLLSGCYISRSKDNRPDREDTLGDSGIDSSTNTERPAFDSGRDKRERFVYDAYAFDTPLVETDSALASREDSEDKAADKIPDPPTWSPIDIDNPSLEAPTWRSSNKPFCIDPNETVDASSIWSDEVSGVYVFFGMVSGNEMILQNDGERWTERYVNDSGLHGEGIRGFEGGILLKYSYRPCAIEIIEGASSVCSAAASSVSDVFVVDRSLAYAVDSNRVLQYDGEMWTQFGDPLEPSENVFAYRVWADPSTVVVASNAGLFRLFRPENSFEKIRRDSAQAYRTVWGFEDKLWAGTGDRSLVFFNGVEWKTVFTSDSGCSTGIQGLWGDGDIVYFYTNTEFGVWESESIRILADFTCDSGVKIKGLWGNSADELFILISDPEYQNSECGGFFTLYYDGKQFIQF